MRDNGASAGVAVVCEKAGEHAAAMTAYLRQEHLADATWFAPRDVDDVDQAVCEGRIGRVVFPDLAGLLDAIWDEEIRFDRWLSAATEVSLVDSTAAGPTATAMATTAAVFESWRKWNQRHRRRQVTAGVIVSAIALVAGFLLTLSIP